MARSLAGAGSDEEGSFYNYLNTTQLDGEGGHGKFNYIDGDYDGQFIIKRHGLGQYEWKNGSKYKG